MAGRDSYGNIPKKRDVVVNTNGDLEVPNVLGELVWMNGTTTMTSGRAVVSGTQITTNSFVVATPKHGGASALSYAAFNGHVIISGTGTGLVAYTVYI
jgi:hypothetical protein